MLIIENSIYTDHTNVTLTIEATMISIPNHLQRLQNEQSCNKFGNILDLFSSKIDETKDIVAEIDRCNGGLWGEM